MPSIKYHLYISESLSAAAPPAVSAASVEVLSDPGFCILEVVCFSSAYGFCSNVPLSCKTAEKSVALLFSTDETFAPEEVTESARLSIPSLSLILYVFAVLPGKKLYLLLYWKLVQSAAVEVVTITSASLRVQKIVSAVLRYLRIVICLCDLCFCGVACGVIFILDDLTLI